MTPTAIFLVAITGLIFGSFINAASYRIPRGQSVADGRSRCPHCGKTLRALDLIPLISWIILLGKCRYCRARIGIAYPLTEIAAATAFLLVYFYADDRGLGAIFLMGMTVCLIMLIRIDLEHYIIPDGLNLAMFVMGAFYNIGFLIFGWPGLWRGFNNPLLFYLGMPAAAAGLAWLLRWLVGKWKGQEALGLGDVKFFAVAGIWLPWPSMFACFLLLSGLLGVALAVLWRLLGNGPRFPFGPALAVALFLCLLFPEMHSMWQNTVLSLLR